MAKDRRAIPIFAVLWSLILNPIVLAQKRSESPLPDKKKIVDVSFNMPLICSDEISSSIVTYARMSFNKGMFCKITDLAYWDSGYPNSPDPQFYTAVRSRRVGRKFTLTLAYLDGMDVDSYGPVMQEDRFSSCVVTLPKSWDNYVQKAEDTTFYKTEDFEVKCDFLTRSLTRRCESSTKLRKLYFWNPVIGKKTPYEHQFTYKWWYDE